MAAPNQLMIDRLKKEMTRMGINARELSDMAKVGRSFIYDILSGKSANPTTKKITAVADALGVSIPYLIAGTSNDNEILKKSKNIFVSVPTIFTKIKKNGSFEVTSKSQGNSNFFRKDWINNDLKIDSQNLRAVIIQDDNMSPTLGNNDMVLIDIARKTPFSPGIFILFDGAGLVAKRLEYLPQSNSAMVRVFSDNHNYSPYECRIEDINVVGRVVWFSRKI